MRDIRNMCLEVREETLSLVWFQDLRHQDSWSCLSLAPILIINKSWSQTRLFVYLSRSLVPGLAIKSGKFVKVLSQYCKECFVCLTPPVTIITLFKKGLNFVHISTNTNDWLKNFTRRKMIWQIVKMTIYILSITNVMITIFITI